MTNYTKAELLNLYNMNLDDLLNESKKYLKDEVEFCSIISARTGKCSQNCKYCAQSSHYNTDIETNPLLDVETVVHAAKDSVKNGADRVAIVTSGKTPDESDFDTMLDMIKALNNAGINAKVIANVSPFDKGNILQNARDISKTVMIGDGINDAIALTSASVGISMRNSTDISMESSSAVLLRNNLTVIEKSHKICKKTLRIIKENLFWAFSYNVVAIPLAVTGFIHPVMSAAFMSFSSLFVVTNSMRIRK